jgi:hypothetical protein
MRPQISQASPTLDAITVDLHSIGYDGGCDQLTCANRVRSAIVEVKESELTQVIARMEPYVL